MRTAFIDKANDLQAGFEGGSILDLLGECQLLCSQNGRMFVPSMVRVFADYDGHLVVQVDEDCPMVKEANV